MKKILIFLDEVYYKQNRCYISKSSAGKFLLNLKETYNLTFAVPVMNEQITSYTTKIEEDNKVIPLPEWDSLISYLKNKKRNNIEIKRRLKQAIEEADIVFVRLPSLPGLVIAEQAYKQKKKVILHLAGDIRDVHKTGKYHGVYNILTKIYGNLIHYKTYSMAKHNNDTRVLCTGHKLMQSFAKVKPEFFVDNEYINEIKFEKDQEEDEFLFVGRLIESKGVIYLIDSWDQMNKKLHIVGAGELEEYVRQCASKNKNIIFHGLKNGVQLEEIYNKCKYLILPSIGTEGFPRVIAEAWCKGLIVIATKVGGINGIAKENENIIFIQEKSSQSIKDAINKLLNDKQLNAKLKEGSKNMGAYVEKNNMLEILKKNIDNKGLNNEQNNM